MTIISNLKKVLKNKNYLVIFLVFTVLFFIGSYYLTIYKIVNLDNFVYVNGVMFSVIYFILSFFIASLLGLYLSLFFYKYNKLNKVEYQNSTGGIFGGFIGALGSGCAGCSFSLFSGIASFFGLSLGLASLPFRGLELKIVSILFLVGANYFSLKNLDKRICKK